MSSSCTFFISVFFWTSLTQASPTKGLCLPLILRGMSVGSCRWSGIQLRQPLVAAWGQLSVGFKSTEFPGRPIRRPHRGVSCHLPPNSRLEETENTVFPCTGSAIDWCPLTTNGIQTLNVTKDNRSKCCQSKPLKCLVSLIMLYKEVLMFFHYNFPKCRYRLAYGGQSNRSAAQCGY